MVLARTVVKCVDWGGLVLVHVLEILVSEILVSEITALPALEHLLARLAPPFPLTPTLSLRERVPRMAVF